MATREKDAFLGLVDEIKVIQELNMLMRHLHARIDQLSKNIDMLIDLLIHAQVGLLQPQPIKIVLLLY